MPNIVIYAAESCPYCRRARALLDSKGARYTVLDVDARSAFVERDRRTHGRDTVPQIFIGDRHIGGCDDLFALERRGELDPLLIRELAAQLALP